MSASVGSCEICEVNGLCHRCYSSCPSCQRTTCTDCLLSCADYGTSHQCSDCAVFGEGKCIICREQPKTVHQSVNGNVSDGADVASTKKCEHHECAADLDVLQQNGMHPTPVTDAASAPSKLPYKASATNPFATFGSSSIETPKLSCSSSPPTERNVTHNPRHPNETHNIGHPNETHLDDI